MSGYQFTPQAVDAMHSTFGAIHLGSAAALSAFHSRSEEFIDARLVTAPLVLEPSKHVGIEANGERLLDGPIKLPDHSAAPVQHFGNVREINFVIRQGSKSRQFLRLFLRYVLHAVWFFDGGDGFEDRRTSARI